jgi:glycosyltransferase involved in cell wall biosynthesis
MSDSVRIRVCIVLDTPNLSTGVATAGLPARMVTLADSLRKAGASVSFILGDRGMTESAAMQWDFEGMLVNPDLLYGPAENLMPSLSKLKPDFIIIADPQVVTMNGRDWAEQVGARLIYEAHDDEAQLARDAGHDDETVSAQAAWQLAAAMTADFVTVLTEREAQTMRSYGVDDEKLLVAPIGIDFAARDAWGPSADSKRLLMIGNLYYHPNTQAAMFLVELVGRMREQGHDVSALIVGRGPEDLINCEVNGVEFAGAVDDLNTVTADVALAVAPIVVGSGQKKKLLDYQAAGLPVLATTEATNGYIEGAPGVVINDDLETWAEDVLRLLSDAESLTQLGTVGREAVMPHFDAAVIAKKALDCYGRWLTMPLSRSTIKPPGIECSEPKWLLEHAAQLGLGNPVLTVRQDSIDLPLR